MSCSLFCWALLCVRFGFCSRLDGLLWLSSWCLMIMVWLSLTIPWVSLQFVIVVFSDFTHYILCNRTNDIKIDMLPRLYLSGDKYYKDGTMKDPRVSITSYLIIIKFTYVALEYIWQCHWQTSMKINNGMQKKVVESMYSIHYSLDLHDNHFIVIVCQ